VALEVALAGLNEAMAPENKLREEEQKAIEASAEKATDKALEMAKANMWEGFFHLTGAVLDGAMDKATHQAQDIVIQRTRDGITEAERRKYDDAFQAIAKDKERIAGGLAALEVAESVHGFKEIDEILSKKDLTPLEKLYAAGSKLMENPGVKAAAELWEPASKALKTAADTFEVTNALQDDLDAAYLLTSEYQSWQNIKQLDRNTDQYLKAVNDLRAKFEAVMKKIKNVEKQIGGKKIAGCE
jgi:hypothetical protein